MIIAALPPQRARQPQPFRRLALALLAAGLVNLALFSVLARLLAASPPSALPAVVEISRAAVPPPPPMPRPIAPATRSRPSAPPSLPQLDLGVAPTARAVVQPLVPITTPLPALAPTSLALPALSEGAAPQAVALPGVVDAEQLDEGVHSLDRHEPEFPNRAQRLGLTDTVTVSFVVHADGSVTDLALVSARHPEYFQEPSFACVRQTHFAPGRKAGQVVDSRCTWTFHYVLPGSR